MIKKILSTNDEVALFIVRVCMGAVMLAHGLQKSFGWFGGGGPVKTIEAFDMWFGLPPAITVLVILAETVGSLLVIIGLGTRLAALSITMVMTGAIAMVTGKWGFFMNWYSEERGEGYEMHILIIAIALALMIRGAGKWSLDRALSAKV